MGRMGIFLFTVVSFWWIQVNAADELYINEGLVFVNGKNADVPTLFVHGDITNHDGAFTNHDGEIELKGDWRNISVNRQYHSTGTEKFSGSTDQNIYGDWDGKDENAFFDLQIEKSSFSGQYVSLHTDVNVKERLVFSSVAGIVRTQAASYSFYPGSGDYQYILSILNDNTSAIQGHSISNGALTRYVEGKLKRAVGTVHADYYFPVGVAPVLTHISMDGMEAVSVRFNSLPKENALTAYLREGVTSLYNNVVFCDIGTDPSPDYDPFLSCVPGAGLDGIIDRANLVTASALEWSVTPEEADDFNYRIEVFPGPILNSSVPILNISICGGPYSEVRYLAKDGIQGGDNAGSLSTGAPVWPAMEGLRVCPTGNVLNNQHSFSIFRIHGTENNMTELPVEFLSIAAEPMNNDHILISWKTATEKNVSHYEVERSRDAVHFEQIGSVRGPSGGYSTMPNIYYLNDWDVQPSVLYYYRVKNIDFDGSYEYSPIASAKIMSNSGLIVGDIFPNPSKNGEGGFYITAPENGEVVIEIFNVLGQYFGEQRFPFSEGKNLIPLSYSNYPSGNYIVKISLRDTVLSRKWIIQRAI